MMLLRFFWIEARGSMSVTPTAKRIMLSVIVPIVPRPERSRVSRARGGGSSRLHGGSGRLEHQQDGALLDQVADLEMHGADRAGGRRRDRVLHLHRLDDDQRMAAL